MAETSNYRKFRADKDLWDGFGEAVECGPDPEADRSKVLRQFMRWYSGEPGARLPERPEPKANPRANEHTA